MHATKGRIALVVAGLALAAAILGGAAPGSAAPSSGIVINEAQQSSTVQRAGQAQVVHDFVARILDIDRKADVVVLGDLNDFQFSPSVAALRTGTADDRATRS